MIEDSFLPSKPDALVEPTPFTTINESHKRSIELDKEYNSMQNSPAPVLSFDAYGNLTSSDDQNKSHNHDLPSLDEFDYILEGFEASFNSQTSKSENCQQDGGAIKKPKNNRKADNYPAPFEPSVAHQELKQAFKSDFNTNSAVTSRYGRTRKQKVAGEDFLVGTINFNELRKITSPKKKRHNSENKSRNETALHSHESACSISQTPKFEALADNIPNFSSEDEFEPEKIKLKPTLNSKKVKRSHKKQIQSSVHIKKEFNKITDEKESTKIKKKLASPLKKRKREGSDHARKRNIRSHIGDAKTDKYSSLTKKNLWLSSDLDNHSKEKIESFKASVIDTPQSASTKEIDLESKPGTVIMNSTEDTVEFSLNFCEEKNQAASHKGEILQIDNKNSSLEQPDSIAPLMDCSNKLLLDVIEEKKNIKPDIIEMETLIDEVEIKENEILTITKSGRPVKKPELINVSFDERKENQQDIVLKPDTSVTEEETFDVTKLDEEELRKILPPEYVVGDLVWVTLKGSPVWPGLVTVPKDLSSYSKVVGNYKNIEQLKEKGVRCYHIQFFCDHFQVSWPRPHSIIKFEGLPKLISYLENFRDKVSTRKTGIPAILLKCNITTLSILLKKTFSPKLSRWYDAIRAGEALMNLDRNERIQKFMAEQEDSLKGTKKAHSPHRKKKSETNNNENDMGDVEEFSGFEKTTGQALKLKSQKLNDKLRNVDFDVYFTKHLKSLQKNRPEISKYKTKKILFDRWSKLSIVQQAKYKTKYNSSNGSSSSDDSSSVDGSASESSNQSTARNKKNLVAENDLDEPSTGTYKLVRNEKVCIHCESVSLLPGGTDMVRCKGPCCGTFHIRCVGLEKLSEGDFKCSSCISGVHECFTCKKVEGEKIKCSMNSCGKFYHEACVKMWPQVNKGRHADKLVCPRHICHMCAANTDDMNDPAAKTAPFTRCLRCPTAYHTGEICIAAGVEEISQSYHICTKHMKIPKNNSHHLNVNWCFCCSKGGSLLLCDQCPAAFHAECMNITAPEGSYICEDCENGKFPVYGDIVWVKLGQFRWWPGQVLHPRYIPDNIENLSHVQGMFCVHFFGSDDYYWVSRGRAFHYQEGDQGSKGNGSKVTEQKFQMALNTALIEYNKQNEKRKKQEESRSLKGKIKPAHWVKIDTNKPVGNVKLAKIDPSTGTKCDCDPYADDPCSSDETCINRMLMVECIRDVCPAGERCQNQRFQKRQYPNVYPFKTSERGWGLRTKDFIKKGSFVIEYVGELIDDAEFRRRIVEMHECKEENYYFLTVETDRMIDAGPKGNLARFMNHSCEPNCETQKWRVGDETRVGLFAMKDISPDSEVTFNYNLECVGTEKKPCHCGAPSCSGFIGSKVQKAGTSGAKKAKFEKKKLKRKSKLKDTDNECFRCGNAGDLILCDISTCPKGYHLECLGLKSLPKGKWLCPWHHCDECGSRAIKRCMMCPNSFCRNHSADKFHSSTGLENVCFEHAADEFEALRGQTAQTAVHDQKNPLGNKVQMRSPDKIQNSIEVFKNPALPVTNLTRKERNHKGTAVSKSPKCNLLGVNQKIERRGRKRKYPQMEKITQAENITQAEAKRQKNEVSVKSEMEVKKRILKSLSNNVSTRGDLITSYFSKKISTSENPSTKSNTISESTDILVNGALT